MVARKYFIQMVAMCESIASKADLPTSFFKVWSGRDCRKSAKIKSLEGLACRPELVRILLRFGACSEIYSRIYVCRFRIGLALCNCGRTFKMKITIDEVWSRLSGSCNGLTKEYLETVPDNRLFSEICKFYEGNIDIRGEEYIDDDDGAVFRCPDRRCFLLLIKELDDQIRNGGFNQYLFNRGKNAHLAHLALKQVCGDKHADILDAVVRSFKLRVQIHDEVREADTAQDLLQRFSDSYEYIDFSEYDRSWYSLRDEREKLFACYVREHLSSFTHENPNTEGNGPSALDVYFDDSEVFRLIWSGKPKWNDEDVDGSRVKRIQHYLKHMNKYIAAKNYVAADCLMHDGIISYVTSWKMADSDVFSKCLHRYVVVLNALNRPKQAAALKSLLEEAGK